MSLNFASQNWSDPDDSCLGDWPESVVGKNHQWTQ